jgi:hypothetical protein
LCIFWCFRHRFLWPKRASGHQHLDLDEDSYFNESEVKDILIIPDQAIIPNTWSRRRGRRAGTLMRLRFQINKPLLPSVLLANVRSLENKLDKLHSRLSYQRDIKNCNILFFSESWLNKDMGNIHYMYKSMWTPFQISGFVYFSHSRCWQVYKIKHTAMQSL